MEGNKLPQTIGNSRTRTPIYNELNYKYRKTERINNEYNMDSKNETPEFKTNNKFLIKNSEERCKSIFKVPLSVEVCIRSDVKLDENTHLSSEENCTTREFISQRVKKYFSLQANVELGKVEIREIGDSFLRKVCKDITLSLNHPIHAIEEKYDLIHLENIPIYQADLNVYIYQLNNISEEEYFSDNSNNEKSNDLPIWRCWSLPNIEFHGLWDVLHYDNNLKQQLVDYISTNLILSSYGIDFNVINWNHLILIYGSPGTGKTSISRAISQKIGMRYSHRYKDIYLIEINANSLFSKWFSESGKTVIKLFSRIKDLLEESSSFATIVIDEIESISSARKQSLARNEPSDSIRVVNALLTQLDGLKKYSNTLIITTTNILDSIDEAFLDRADLKLYIPLPSIYTRYLILLECIEELIRKEIIHYKDKYFKILGFKEILRYNDKNIIYNYESGQILISTKLLYISKKIDGFSGRNLRKLPFIVLLSCYHYGVPLEIEIFIEKMKYIVDEKLEIIKS